MKFKKNLLLFFVLISSLTITASAQKTWEKPPQKWGKDETIKLLSSSPWAKMYQSTTVSQKDIQAQAADRGGNNARSIPRNFGQFPVVLRLHSALPIRQALVRIRQIEAGYDKMNEKQRAEFDKTTEGFLSCPICKDYYVLTLTKFVDTTAQYVDEGVFQKMGLEQLKGNVWLVNEKGERRELVQFNPPKNPADAAVFYFARTDDKGVPFLTPESKSFELQFNNAFMNSRNPYAALLPLSFDFSVSKLIVDGNLLF